MPTRRLASLRFAFAICLIAGLVYVVVQARIPGRPKTGRRPASLALAAAPLAFVLDHESAEMGEEDGDSLVGLLDTTVLDLATLPPPASTSMSSPSTRPALDSPRPLRC